jgi:trans-2,3-dihydro-3-hydroxyanthranilate isomerase
MNPMRLNFITVDVFTDRQFGGNPLAVVVDADGLSSEQMQRIAAEFNLAETTFVLPPKAAEHTAHVRIFTPRAEMPFAGHPNVGTAFVVAREGSCYGRPLTGQSLMFEEAAGLVRIELLKQGSEITGARLAAPQPLVVGDTMPADVVAEACSIAVTDIETRNHAPCIAGCGAPFVFAELKRRSALAEAQPRVDAFPRHFPRERVTGIHLYVRTDEDALDLQSRTFAPLHGVAEDPATGSANVALVGLLAKLRSEPDLRLSLKIGQGFDMGRPSLLLAHADKAAGQVVATFIGGTCIPVMRGVLDVIA